MSKRRRKSVRGCSCSGLGKRWWEQPKYKYGFIAAGVLIAMVWLRNK